MEKKRVTYLEPVAAEHWGTSPNHALFDAFGARAVRGDIVDADLAIPRCGCEEG